MEESTTFLTGATHLGARILEYTLAAKHDELRKLVGEQQFRLISPQLDKYEFAARNLNKIKCTSTEGEDAAAG